MITKVVIVKCFFSQHWKWILIFAMTCVCSRKSTDRMWVLWSSPAWRIPQRWSRPKSAPNWFLMYVFSMNQYLNLWIEFCKKRGEMLHFFMYVIFMLTEIVQRERRERNAQVHTDWRYSRACAGQDQCHEHQWCKNPLYTLLFLFQKLLNTCTNNWNSTLNC